MIRIVGKPKSPNKD